MCSSIVNTAIDFHHFPLPVPGAGFEVRTLKLRIRSHLVYHCPTVPFKFLCGKMSDLNHNTKFPSKLMNEPNKLECASPASLSSLVLCDTLAYWAQFVNTLQKDCIILSFKLISYSIWISLLTRPGNTNGRSITVLLTSCLTCLD